MADNFTKIDNSAKDLPKQVQKNLEGDKSMYQVYGDAGKSVKDMFGKSNQTNTLSGVEMSNEKRKARR